MPRTTSCPRCAGQLSKNPADRTRTCEDCGATFSEVDLRGEDGPDPL